jgi:hypothetical protein
VKSSAGAIAFIESAASGICIEAATVSAQKYIIAQKSAPTPEKSFNETENIPCAPLSSPEASLFETSMDTATGSPAVDIMKSKV